MPTDISQLPDVVRLAARIDEHGETSWLDSNAAAAVDALIDAGYVVLGLDVRFYDEEDRFFEVALSDFDGHGSERAAASRHAALEALARIDDVLSPTTPTAERRILITWERLGD